MESLVHNYTPQPTLISDWFVPACFSDEELVHTANAGNNEAAEMLLRRYRPLVESRAKEYYLLGGEHEDVVQEGMIGLFKAIRDYRQDKQLLFRAFAELCVTRHILTAVKRASRIKHLPMNSYISLYNSSSKDKEMNGILLDTLPDSGVNNPEYIVLQRYTTTGCLESANHLLSDLEKQVLDGYLEGKSYREISVELNCAPKRIDNALQRIKRKLEKWLAQD